MGKVHLGEGDQQYPTGFTRGPTSFQHFYHRKNENSNGINLKIGKCFKAWFKKNSPGWNAANMYYN